MLLKKHNEKFIIPFIFDDSYEEVLKKFKETRVNNDNYFREIDELKETELHAFINRRFWSADEGHCGIFELNQNVSRDVYVTLYDTLQKLDIKITDVQFYVFKSGILFMVISTLYQKTEYALTLYDVQETNAALKDLYPHKNRFLIFDKNLKLKENIPFVESGVIGRIEKVDEVDENGIQTALLYQGLTNTTESVNAQIQLFSDKNTKEFISFENGLFTTIKNKPNMIKCYKQEDFCFNSIIIIILDKLNINFSNYLSSSDEKILPKKAILFNMNVLQGKEDVSEELFYLANGYSHKYQYSHSKKNILTTFQNSYWMVSREGLSNINTIVENEDDHFLNNEFETKFNTIYLWIMLLVLHQYYGFQYFNCELLKIYQESLKIDKSEKKKKKYDDQLGGMKKIKARGEEFMLKYSFSDISQITHQNDIYAEMCKVYSISALINQYKSNIEICNKMIEQKQQKTVEKKLNFITIITTIFTTFTSITQTLLGIVNLGDGFVQVIRIVLGIVAIILVLLGLLKKK